MSERIQEPSVDQKRPWAGKPYLSPTRVEMMGKCPEMYRRRYIEGEIIPPGVASMKGTGFHAGSKANFRQKIETRQDLPATDIVEIAASAFEKATKDGYVLTPEEEGRGHKIVLGEAKDALVDMATFHAKHQAPDYQPVFVEEKIIIGLPGPRDLLGVIDLADDKDRVIDFKTAGRSKSQADADSSIQLTTYNGAFTARTGRIPLLVLDTVVKTKTKIYRNKLETTRSVKDMQSLVNRINAILGAIEHGIFLPTSPGSWWCAAKWCGYWSTCPYVNSERKEASQDE